jgi:hypothetical protein
VRQFDVFVAENGNRFCVLQNDLLDPLDTVMVAPLIATSATPMSRLTPVLDIEGRRYLLDLPLQVPARSASLRHETPVASLENQRDQILDALNLLYWGI